MLLKLPPIEKIPEAFTAIADERVQCQGNEAIVLSSDLSKQYHIHWEDHIYYSDDSATYWQGYPGYPIIAVLMLQGKLTYNIAICNKFKGIEWNSLNQKFKRDYGAAFRYVLSDILHCSNLDQNIIQAEISKIFKELENLDILCKRATRR